MFGTKTAIESISELSIGDEVWETHTPHRESPKIVHGVLWTEDGLRYYTSASKPDFDNYGGDIRTSNFVGRHRLLTKAERREALLKLINES